MTHAHDFPISIQNDNTTQFLNIFDRQIVRTSSITSCKNRPSVTYLRDHNSQYYMITSEGNASAFTVQENSLKETAAIKLKKIRGFDRRLLTPATLSRTIYNAKYFHIRSRCHAGSETTSNRLR